MERIQVNRFSFRRKNSSRNKNKEREQLVDYDYERMSYLRWGNTKSLSLAVDMGLSLSVMANVPL